MKFSLEWIGDRVAVAEAGGAEGVRKLLDGAGLPVESVEGSGEGAIFDVEITPNRPDAMSHRGLAREVAAMAGLAFREGDAVEPPAAGPAAGELASVEIAVPRLCRRFGARVVRGIASAASSGRVRARLAAIGAKAIDAAVDATNYALWDLGQPLHAFDLDKLAGGRIVVRKARRGERLVTLDGVERALEPSDVVVADGERPVSLAGIMGGLDTAVSPATKNVLLEAAWWDPVSIRRTSRRLGMHTDASHRFERGADAEAIPEALDLAARLLLEAAGGTLAPSRIDARGAAVPRRKVVLRLERLRRLAGEPRLDLDFAAGALARLGFRVTTRSARRLTAEVPSFRSDVSIEEDLVEEVLRVWGYGRLPSRLPATAGAGAYLEPRRVVEDRLTDAAVAAGLHETYSYPFADREDDESAFAPWLEATGTARKPLGLTNPVDASKRELRATLLPGILDAASHNFRHGARQVALFEVGRAFGSEGDPGRPETFESRRFAFALGGESPPALDRARRLAGRGFLRREGSLRAPRRAVDRPGGARLEAVRRAGVRPRAPRPDARRRPELSSASPGSWGRRSVRNAVCPMGSRPPRSSSRQSPRPGSCASGRSRSIRRSSRTSPFRIPRRSLGSRSTGSSSVSRSRTSSRSGFTIVTRGPASPKVGSRRRCG